MMPQISPVLFKGLAPSDAAGREAGDDNLIAIGLGNGVASLRRAVLRYCKPK
jgi:hypothetical protein